MALSIKRIRAATTPGRYGDGHGLYLQVRSATSRAWVLRTERSGKIRWMGLGSLADYTLDEARERARKARQLLHDGIDPIEARKAEHKRLIAEAAAAAAKDISFEKAAEQYFNFHSPSWKNAKHRAQFLSSLKTYAYPVLGRLPVGVIDKTHVLQVLQPIWQGKNETASRIRGRIESVLDYSKTNGWRTGENAAAWTGNLEHALPAPARMQTEEHHPALDFSAMPAFVAALRQRQHLTVAANGIVLNRIGIAALALEFTILTAARTGEVIGARWDEINLENKVWYIPPGRIKGGREHRVVLSERALEILRGLPREQGNPFVFIGSVKGSHIASSAMAQLMKKGSLAFVSTTAGRLATVHGMRSTFKDWATETTSYPNDMSEIALAHKVGDETEQAYRRGDMLVKRRKMMEDWSRYCGRSDAADAADAADAR
jgi:integrase